MLKKLASAGICAMLLFAQSVTASALVKEVVVWGAKSVNDKGGSDLRITMDELKEDFQPFLQTSGMSEFFHKDQAPSPKVDMTEELSWLIDNEILIRDETVRISGLSNIPSVSISKADIPSVLYQSVTRSDALMYIHKATFGPLYARTLGAESTSVRVQDGSEITLANLIASHFTGLSAADVSYGGAAPAQGTWGTEKGQPGANGTVGSGIFTQLYQNDANAYRYTPQGDEYTSVFGDTNIFISENHFDQRIENTRGSEAGAGGDVSIVGRDNMGSGGRGGDAGYTGNQIFYETDYKSVFCTAGSDLLFYRTNDAVEMYLQSLLSKGILQLEDPLVTTKFRNTFSRLARDNSAFASWSGSAYPHIVNLRIGQKMRVDNVMTSATADILGENFTVSSSSGGLTIQRTNLFDANTGYFTTESVTRMDIYRYIYQMVYANEKKLSDLERDIVNYKYGLELEGYAPEEDLEVIKYLIAVGILDYNGSSELQNLYGGLTWNEFLPILYRVANKNARLDFSKIQLTDSEQSWKAKGFAPQTLAVVPSNAMGVVRFEYDVIDTDTSGGDTTDTLFVLPVNSKLVRVVHAEGKDTPQILQETVVHSYLADNPTSGGTIKFEASAAGHLILQGAFFDFSGALLTDQAGSDYYLPTRFEYYLQQLRECSREELLADVFSDYDADNPKHALLIEICRNIYAMSILQSNRQIYNECVTRLNSWYSTYRNDQQSQLGQARAAVYNGLLEHLRRAATGELMPNDISFQLNNTAGSNRPQISSDSSGRFDTVWARNLTAITFRMMNTQTGREESYRFEYTGEVTFGPTATRDQLVDAMNSTAAEYSKVFTAAELQAKGAERLKQELSSSVGSLALSKSYYVQQQADTNGNAYISWTQLESAINPDGTPAFQLKREGKNVLINPETNTRAYLEGTRAIIGNEVVNLDDGNTMVFTAEDGTDYYHIKAIRYLINAAQESAVLANGRIMSVASPQFTSAITNIPVVSDRGVIEGHLPTVRIRLSRDYNTDSQTFRADSYWHDGVAGRTVVMRSADSTESFEWWGDFISLSQSNRAVNTLSRRLQFIPVGRTELDRVTAYAILDFVAVDVNALGSAGINVNTSLADLLNAPAQPPEGEEARREWNENKRRCNLYANWIYGTTDKEYIQTGYLSPQLTIYVTVTSSGEKHP